MPFGPVAATYEPLILFVWPGLRRRRDALMILAQALHPGRVWSPVPGRPAVRPWPDRRSRAPTVTRCAWVRRDKRDSCRKGVRLRDVAIAKPRFVATPRS